MTARNTEMRLEASSRHQGLAQALLLLVFRSVLTITRAKAIAASSPILQRHRIWFPYREEERGRRTKPPGFWNCNNSVAEIQVMSVTPCRAFTPFSITGTQLRANAQMMVGWGTRSIVRTLLLLHAEGCGVRQIQILALPLPPLGSQVSHSGSFSSSVKWRLK